jgi:hypothetical protein
MGSSTNPTVTLQGTLMNHSSIMHSLAAHVTLAAELRNYTTVPYVLGETNSLSGGGASGLSNVFGSALWVVDYSLYAASQGILRAHFHQSTTSPYAAWTPNGTLTTNPPYYGNVMVNAAIGDAPGTVIASLELQDNEDPLISAYILHNSDRRQLSRVVILNMHEWDSTTAGARPLLTFALTVPAGVRGAHIERLSAAGADVTTGVTYAGMSYDYDLRQGKPVVVDEAATTEKVMVERHTSTLIVDIQDTEGVVLHLF